MCGVVGVFGVENAYDVTLDMMETLQPRGHQSSGIVLVGENSVLYERELGNVSDLLYKLRGVPTPENTRVGLGHVRYGTAGSRDSLENAQPFYAMKSDWEIYCGHNGDTPYHKEIRQSLMEQGSTFTTTSDTECILKYVGMSRAQDPITAIKEGLCAYRGTYAIAMLIRVHDEWMLVAARDHYDNRPLFLGKIGEGWLIASEDVAFETVDGITIREIHPGELLVISKNGLASHTIPLRRDEIPKPYRCVFELAIYFSFPNSHPFGLEAGLAREELGRIMARKMGHLIREEDVLTGVPDSANAFLDGFSEELMKFPKRAVIRKHSYRSFTQANRVRRERTVRKKFSFSPRKVRGKRVWVLDDSLVRGHTARKVVRALRKHGAIWVGVISSAPPIIGPCRKGIDFDEGLVATAHLTQGVPDIEKIREEIEADCLIYAELEDLRTALRACNSDPRAYCYGCFEGRDPVFNAW